MDTIFLPRNSYASNAGSRSVRLRDSLPNLPVWWLVEGEDQLHQAAHEHLVTGVSFALHDSSSGMICGPTTSEFVAFSTRHLQELVS